jgi:prepilin-type N-terminal cleavage/methylation domain-containing protein
MKANGLGRLIPNPWGSRPSLATKRDDADGFTLVELLITVTILPIIIGGMTLSLIAILSLQGSVVNRLGDSGDAQAVSANFVKDVQSSSLITTKSASTSPVPCGTTSQILGLQWGNGTEISYVEVSNGSGTSQRYSIYRYLCQNSNTATPVSSSLVATDAPANLGHPTLSPTASNTAASAGWTTTFGVTGVVLQMTEPGSGYTFTLTGYPAAGASSTGQSTSSQTSTTTCNFASAGTGTYASSLCFVDFTSFGQSGSPTCATGGQKVSASIFNTPYNIAFCITDTGGAVAGAAIPTYYDPPTSEAFLGNNGFYTGIPGNPAIYQTVEGTTSVVTITQIQVLDGNGNAASGWELVAGDAESSDAGESITWTSNQTMSLLPNTPTSSYGNDCGTTTPGVTSLTGLGTTTVTCTASVSSDKTGTVMLEALNPTSMTVTLVGSGLQAMFLGVLLPS